MIKLVYIGAFGLAGVYFRYLLSNALNGSFPFGTFAINLLGSFLIGVVYILGMERTALQPEIRIGLMVGFLGGFTTFSSLCLETVRLFEEGAPLSASFYLFFSNALGLLAVWAGMGFARRF